MNYTNSDNIEWNDVIKKEARGINDEDFGEVQDVQGNYVQVQKGMINKEKYYIPKDQAESYDGDTLRFRISEQDLSQFQHEPPTIYGENTQDVTTTKNQQRNTEEEETSIPLTEERLDVSKKSQENQATITKRPVKETKTIEVPVTREEISIEKRSPTRGSEMEAQSSPIQSEEEIKIPLRKEEVEVTKKPYVKEEVAVKKKKVTDKRKVTEDVTSEELDTSNLKR
ncbi:MAG TPA: YsnF/AvaK domain-containing protein [Nitrososphaeraceae archaeon]|nr:YsnF/AvaK domain-containing protein [Nitrososphaeraceae archaeon]